MKNFTPVFINLPQLRSRFGQLRNQAGPWLERHWLKLLAVAFFCFLLLERNLTLEIRLSTSKPYLGLNAGGPPDEGTALNTSPKGGGKAVFTSEDQARRRHQLAYVRRFAKVAQSEMGKYGIPASIKLAQGLLESQAGRSPIAQRNNNHFGIKCFSRNCRKGHCSNFQDDTHKDFFRIYPTAWESYRAHSLMLRQNERYQSLFALPAGNYRAWAKGLSEAGYATDPHYTEKVIRLIEELGLERYDGG